MPDAPRSVTPDNGRRGRTVFAAVLICAAIPALLVLGSRVWDNRKYYLVSMLVIVLAMLPFALKFEHRRPQARELVILAVMTAIGVAGRAAFAMLPQFKPVVAVVIVAGVAFGGEAGFITGAAIAFLSNFFFGQGPWTPWQMFGFGIIGFLAGLLFAPGRLRARRLPLCIFGGLATLVIYGLTLDSASVLMLSGAVTWQALLASYASGLVFNVIHAAATVVFLALAGEPLLRKLDRIKTKYGILEA